MSKKLLTREQIKKLQENPYVRSVTPRVITFTPEFKKWAYDQMHYGKLISQIFEEAGFDIELIGKRRMDNFRALVEKAADREEGFAFFGSCLRIRRSELKTLPPERFLYAQTLTGSSPRTK